MTAIRLEVPGDEDAVGAVTEAAFRTAPHSGGYEHRIVAALRAAGALHLSLVAVEGETVVGHAAFSPVRINGEAGGWFGLGPVSVRPQSQGRGVGQGLVKDGLARLAAQGAAGCVVFGDPAYYGRFGFEADPAFSYEGAPPGYFQRRIFVGSPPAGAVSYHPAFEVP